MWGNFAELTKQLSTQLSENASQLAASSGLEGHLEKAKSSVTGGLDALASNILTVEPATAGRQDGFATPRKANGPTVHTPEMDDDDDNGWSGDEDMELEDGDMELKDQEGEGDRDAEEAKAQPRTPLESAFTDISLEDTPLPGAPKTAPRMAAALEGVTAGDLSKLRQANQVLRRENAALKKRAAAAEKDAKDSAERAEQAEEKAFQADEALSCSQRSASDELQAEVEALRSSAKDAQDKCLRLEVALEEARQEQEVARTEFERQLHAVTAVIQPPSLKVAPAPEEMEELRAKLKEEKEACKKWEEEASAAQNEAANLKETLARVKASASECQQCLAKVLERLHTVSHASEAAQGASRAASENSAEEMALEKELLAAQLASDAAPAYQALGHLHVRLEAMEVAKGSTGSLASSKSGFEGRAAAGGASERERQLNLQLEATMAQMAEWERKAAAAAGEAEHLRQQVALLHSLQEKGSAESEEAIEGFQAELEAVRKQLQAATEKAAEVPVLQSEISGLTAALNSALQDAESKGAGEAGMAAQVANAESELASHRAQMAKLQKELKASRSVVKGHQQEIAQLEQEVVTANALLQQQLQESEAQGQLRVRGLETELVATRERHQEAIEGYCAEMDALKLKVVEKQGRVAHLEGQLAAVQEGSTASQKLAHGRLADLTAKTEAAQLRAETAERVAKEADEAAAAAMEAASSAQLKMAEREDQLRAAEAKIAKLAEELSLERETAAVDKTTLEGQFESLLARKVDKARAEGREEGEAAGQQMVDRLQGELASSLQQLDEAQAELKKAKAELLVAGEADSRAASAARSNQQLQEELQKAFAKVAEFREAAESAAKESASHRATAAERTKKFALLQAQFRKKEEGLLARAEAAEAALESATACASESAWTVEAAAKAQKEAERERDTALSSLEEAEARMEALKASLEEQREQCDAACSKVAALEVSLEAAKAAAEVGGTADQEYFERMAEVGLTHRRGGKRIVEAQAELARLEREIDGSQERATRVEQAKI